MAILLESIKPETSNRIDLYSLDLSNYGQPALNFYTGYNQDEGTNLITYSNKFDNSSWTAYYKKPPSAIYSNDGVSFTMANVRAAGTLATGFLKPTGSLANTQYTVSIWAKSTTPITISLGITDGKTINITTTSEWVRYTYTGTTTTAGRLGQVYVLVANNTAVPDSTVIQFKNMQVELGGVATSYVNTLSANSPTSLGAVYFNGVKYLPSDVKVSGFEWSGKGTPPTPKLSLSTINIDGSSNALLLGLINSYNNLQGAKFTRIRTYKKFLDYEPNYTDTIKSFSIDSYVIDRKSAENKYYVEFELTSIIDQDGLSLPRNLITASYCPWRYRTRNSTNTAWVYYIGPSACPYIGTKMFDINGVEVTDPLLDVPSKQFTTCCKPRFPDAALPNKTDTFPFGGFIGAGNVSG